MFGLGDAVPNICLQQVTAENSIGLQWPQVRSDSAKAPAEELSWIKGRGSLIQQSLIAFKGAPTRKT